MVSIKEAGCGLHQGPGDRSDKNGRDRRRLGHLPMGEKSHRNHGPAWFRIVEGAGAWLLRTGQLTPSCMGLRLHVRACTVSGRGNHAPTLDSKSWEAPGNRPQAAWAAGCMPHRMSRTSTGTRHRAPTPNPNIGKQLVVSSR